jgi:hypothetical protein
MNKLIRCVHCDKIFFKTPYDQCPEYDLTDFSPARELRSVEKDDYAAFERAHQGHRLEDLFIIEDSYMSEQDYIEPVKTSYFKATNGREKFVVKKCREDIGEPLKYELVPGDYTLRCTSFEIQSREISKQMEKDFVSRPFSKAKREAFLKLYQHVSETIDLRTLERVPEESKNPSEIYYKMDDVTHAYLLRNCRTIFSPQEYADMETFIERHRNDGALLLKATHRVEIKEARPSRSKASTAALPLEQKKAERNI